MSTPEPYSAAVNGYMFDFPGLQLHLSIIDEENKELVNWFNIGMLQFWNFNMDEAIRCFMAVLRATGLTDTISESDISKLALPDTIIASATLAAFMISYAAGVNYNCPEPPSSHVDMITSLYQTAHKLKQSMSSCPSNLHLLINALAHRVDTQLSIDGQNEAFAKALQQIYDSGNTGPDVACIHVCSQMQLRPWTLWEKDSDGNIDSETKIIQAVLEKELQQFPDHPGLCHLFIHLMEMSPTPAIALPQCEVIRVKYTDMGHLLHMPSHIDMLVGDYERGVNTNKVAVKADLRLLSYLGKFDLYHEYLLHNYHMQVWAALFDADFDSAMEAAIGSRECTSKEMLEKNADDLEGMITDEWHVLVRFGKWQEIIDKLLPEDTRLMLMTTAVAYYCKSLAYATLGYLDAAEEQYKNFNTAVSAVPATRHIFNNTCADLLKIAKCMLEGELYYRKGKFEGAFERLREGVTLELALPYDEPWGWMQPVSHALGGLLFEQGKLEEAEKVFRADLKRYPNNVWSLTGLAGVLKNDSSRAQEYNDAVALQKIRSRRAKGLINKTCFCQGHPVISSQTN